MSALSNETHAEKKRFWLVYFAGLVVLALFFLITRVTMRPPAPDEDEVAKAENRVKIVEDLYWANLEKLTVYDWVDREKETVRIPIDRAMELVIPVLNSGEPRPAYPVAPPPGAAPATGETPEADAEPEAASQDAGTQAPEDAAASEATEAQEGDQSPAPETGESEAAPESTPAPATEAPAGETAPPNASNASLPENLLRA